VSSSFYEFLGEHAQEINDYLARYFRHQTDNADMERYLYAPLGHYSANAGKRHRPLICMLAATAVGGEPSHAMSCAAAIEHFQSAALIHDDIADNGQLRRGEPCLHISEGVGIAINCGDYALSLTCAAVANDPALDDALKVRLIRELTAMTARTIEGQALDLGWVRDGRFDLNIEDYLVMATHKTAFYSGAVPLACGAIIGGGSEEQIEALRSFGLNTGLAFQIQDDLLNLVGKKEAANKDFRSDITEGKRTLVAVHALNYAGTAEHDELMGILTSGTEDADLLARAVEIMQNNGSIAFARSYAMELTEAAKAALESIELDEHCRELLLSMADFFVERLN
jgi:geranylgeranyl diphosphate synthase, type I